jgi:hypothetical protein
MQLKKLKQFLVSTLLALGLSAASTQTAHAQGFPVFDWSNWESLGSIWSEDISTGVKIEQTVQQGTQLISNGLNVYNLAMRETTALRNKQWMLAAGYLSNLSIPGHSNWTIALRSAAGPLVAAGVWQEMTRPGATLQNRIQIADAFGTSMANSLESCNSAAMQSDGAIGQLESIALSMSTLDNTRAALGGATNMGLTQQLRIQECQHNLQQQQAQIQMLQLMRQRDQENAQLTTYQNIDAIATSNPRGITNLSALNLADFN